MRDRPILFSAPMVLALIAGRKTQTRRLLKPGTGQKWLRPETIDKVERWAPSVDAWWTMAVGPESRIVHCSREMDGGHIGSVRCPFGQTGDRLWVKESWATEKRFNKRKPSRLPTTARVHYLANGPKPEWAGRSRPSIFMRKWMSRLTLEVREVRVERLQAISEADATAEGVEVYDGIGPDQRVPGPGFNGVRMWDEPHRLPFADLWDSINGENAWAKNPWIWVVGFRVFSALLVRKLDEQGTPLSEVAA